MHGHDDISRFGWPRRRAPVAKSAFSGVLSEASLKLYIQQLQDCDECEPPRKIGDDMINITSIHLTGGTQHQHIASMKWRNPETGAAGESTQQEMVEWIRDKNGVANVHGSDGSVSRVGVVDAHPPYVPTHADGDWNDNLLALPTY
jgi:hypothetical protein